MDGGGGVGAMWCGWVGDWGCGLWGAGEGVMCGRRVGMRTGRRAGRQLGGWAGERAYRWADGQSDILFYSRNLGGYGSDTHDTVFSYGLLPSVILLRLVV